MELEAESGSVSGSEPAPTVASISGKVAADVVPAKWEIIRSGNEKAMAKTLLNGLTVGELAGKIGLNKGELLEWLTLPPNGTVT